MCDKLLTELFRRSPLVIILIGFLIFLTGVAGGLKIYILEWVIKDSFGRNAVLLLGSGLILLGIAWLIYNQLNPQYSNEEPVQQRAEHEYQDNIRNYQNIRYTVPEAVSLLGESLGQTRVDSIRDLYLSLPILSPDDVAELLGHLLGSSRVDAIGILSPKIKRPITSRGAELILDSLLGSFRQEGIKALGIREE